MADIFSASDPYENEDRFRTWLGYVIAENLGHRDGVPAPGYDTGDVHRKVNWAPDMMRGYDLHQLDDAYDQLTEVWKSLDDELHKNAEQVKVIFDGWESEAKAAAVGYLGSIVDVVTQECSALSSFAQVVIAFYGFIYSARRKIDALMGIFCDMCEKKFADAAAENTNDEVQATFEQIIITVSVSIAVTVGTGGTAFPAVLGVLGSEVAGRIADEFTNHDAEATAPSTHWADIVDWYLARQDELAVMLDKGFQDIGGRARLVEHPDIDRLAEVDSKYLPNSRKHRMSEFGPTSRGPGSATSSQITSRLDGTAPGGPA